MVGVNCCLVVGALFAACCLSLLCVARSVLVAVCGGLSVLILCG